MGLILKYQRGNTLAAPTQADSLAVYNSALALDKFYNYGYPNKRNIETHPPIINYYEDLLKSNQVEEEHLVNDNVNTAYRTLIQKNGLGKNGLHFYSDVITPIISPNAPVAMYNEKIKPQGVKHIEVLSPLQAVVKELVQKYPQLNGKINDSRNHNEVSQQLFNNGVNKQEFNNLFQWYKQTYPVDNVSTFMYYDPIMVKPYSMLTPQEKLLRIQKEKQYNGKSLHSVAKPLPKPDLLTPKFQTKMEENANLNFVKRYMNPMSHGRLENEDGSVSAHRMMSWDNFAAPTIVEKDGKLVQLSDEEAIKYAMETGEYLKFDNDDEANKFAANGYKKVKPQSVNRIAPKELNASSSGKIIKAPLPKLNNTLQTNEGNTNLGISKRVAGSFDLKNNTWKLSVLNKDGEAEKTTDNTGKTVNRKEEKQSVIDKIRKKRGVIKLPAFRRGGILKY